MAGLVVQVSLEAEPSRVIEMVRVSGSPAVTEPKPETIPPDVKKGETYRLEAVGSIHADEVARVSIVSPEAFDLDTPAGAVVVKSAEPGERRTEIIDLAGQETLKTQYPARAILSARAVSDLTPPDAIPIIPAGTSNLHYLDR
jgi:hypothetical protein